MCFRPANVIPDSISSNTPTMADAEGMREDVCEEEEEGMDSSSSPHPQGSERVHHIASSGLYSSIQGWQRARQQVRESKLKLGGLRDPGSQKNKLRERGRYRNVERVTSLSDCKRLGDSPKP